MADIRKITLQIGGAKYPITTSEEEEYVQELAREIDKQLRQMMDSSRLALNEALVLLSLSYLDAYKKAEEGADHLRSQIAEYLEEASKARLEAGEARKELARLEAGMKDKK